MPLTRLKNYYFQIVSVLAGLGLGVALLAPATAGKMASGPWNPLEPGLEFGTFLGPEKSESGDSLIRILRIDPARFEFKLMNASNSKTGKPLSARQWARQYNLKATINASMYQADHMTSVSLMRSRGHVNNTWFSKDRALLAFHPKSKQLPAVQILDRDCQKVQELGEQYDTLIQSIRMISCDRKNTWTQQPNKKWSAAAIGQDAKGRILFIHSRSPYTTHDLIDQLLKLPLNLKRAMYSEGGPESQLYIHTAGQEMEFVGDFNTTVSGEAGNTIGWPIPNVVGIVPRSSQ